MPNWCSTNYTITFKSEEEAKRFYEQMDSWQRNVFPPEPYMIGEGWLGNILHNSGVCSVMDENGNRIDPEVSCRGWVEYLDHSGCEVTVQTETAWGPMHEGLALILDKYAPDAEVTYTSEECGCSYYGTNDPAYDGLYVVNMWELPEWFKQSDDYSYEYEYADDFSEDDLRVFAKLLKASITGDMTVEEVIETILDTEGVEGCIEPWDFEEEFIK